MILHNIDYAQNKLTVHGTVSGIVSHFTEPSLSVRGRFSSLHSSERPVLVTPDNLPILGIYPSPTNPLQVIQRKVYSGFCELIKLFRLFSSKTSKLPENRLYLANPLNIGLFLSFGGCHE
jgi:hypothetical protein